MVFQAQGAPPIPGPPPLPPSAPPPQPAGPPQPGPVQPPGQQPSPQIRPPVPGTPVFNRPPPQKPIRIITSQRRGMQQYIKFAIPVIVLIGLVIYFIVLPGVSTQNSIINSTMPTTTVLPAGQLYSCTHISSPGAYFVASNLKQTALNGTCISITASNVSIVCDGKVIGGSGPYTDVGPFSYGIKISGKENVSVSGCTISNFSYGVFAQSVSELKLLNSNITTNFVSDVYLQNTTNGTASNDYIANSSSTYGAVVITNGSSGNRFSNNTLKKNAIYGFNITSAGNKFINNYISESKFSFICSAQAGFAFTGFASGNTCYNSSGCGFVSCSGLNIPVNLSKVILGSIISTCGVINRPGNYSLAHNLDMRDYVNYSSSPSPYSDSCLNVKASGVTLTCGGFDINNAYIGVYSNGTQNLTMSGCNVNDSQTGMMLKNVFKPSILDSVMARNNVSVNLINATGALMSNANTSGGKYGVIFQSSAGDIIRNFTANFNEFGMYLNASEGDTFANGKALNNTAFDIFITGNTSNQNIMTSTQCYLSDAMWSTCALKTSNQTLSFPLISCTNIKRSGTYTLQSQVIGATPGCMTISSNNVVLNCANFTLQAQTSTPGAAIVINRRSNVTVKDCRMANFNSGVIVANSTEVNITAINTTDLASSGIVLYEVTNASLSRNLLTHTANASILLDRVSNSIVEKNNMTDDLSPNIALEVENSTHNLIFNNYGDTNFMGMGIFGASRNNTISNNTFGGDGSSDFQCAPTDSGLNAEQGGINYGVKKSGCYWLAAIPPYSMPLPCAGTNQPTLYSLTGDAAYYSGSNDSRCFSMTGAGANSSTINCNGHTVLATNGGTFAVIQNTGQITVENCYLKGFTKAVVGVNASATILNNTIFMNGSRSVNTSAVNFTRSSYVAIQNNNITTPYTGVYIGNVIYTKLFYNNVTALQTAYAVYRSTALQIDTNSSRTSGIGMLLSNTTESVFAHSQLDGLLGGLICTGTSQGRINNTDAGYVSCSSQSKCLWLSQSSTSC